MINQDAADCLKRSTFSKNFCKPVYDTYGFSTVPGTIKKLFGLKGDFTSLPAQAVGGKYAAYDLVILFFVDGFGWRFFEKYAERYPFLKRFIESGVASKISSQFPSTTANHVTCISTGLDVGESGVYEWFYYEPKVDRVIAPLLYAFAGDTEDETLKRAPVSPLELFPKRTLFEDLHSHGITSYAIQHLDIAHSTYSEIMLRGAKALPYKQLKQGLQNCLEIALAPKAGPNYLYFYCGDIDGVGHRQGIDSSGFEKTVDSFWTMMEELFWKKLSNPQQKIACLVIADHGMTALDPKKTFYLNEEIPQIEKIMRRNQAGDLIVPAGSCRDFFLHVERQHLDEAVALLTPKLEGRAEVYKTESLIKQNFFGLKKPSREFLERVGELVILPYANEAVWWYKKGHFEQRLLGAHGGLTRDEMETIFLFLEI